MIIFSFIIMEEITFSLICDEVIVDGYSLQ